MGTVPVFMVDISRQLNVALGILMGIEMVLQTASANGPEL